VETVFLAGVHEKEQGIVLEMDYRKLIMAKN
jgi:hypothetical protein